MIPEDRRVMLVLKSPIREYRKIISDLAREIQLVVAEGSTIEEVWRKATIRGNEIEIKLNRCDGGEKKKVTAVITNKNSSPNILQNAIYILEDRIITKAKKCSAMKWARPVWLALFNDYFLADADTYRNALTRISVAHEFKKIVLVSENKSVDTIFGETQI